MPGFLIKKDPYPASQRNGGGHPDHPLRRLVGVIRMATEYSLLNCWGGSPSPCIPLRYFLMYLATRCAGACSGSIRAVPTKLTTRPSATTSALKWSAVLGWAVTCWTLCVQASLY